MKNGLMDFLLLFLASRTAAVSYIYDDGPAEVFKEIDEAIVKKVSDEENAQWWLFVLDASRCVKCFSLWTSLCLLILRAMSRKMFLLVAIPLAIGGLSAIGTAAEEAIEKIVYGEDVRGKL